MTNPADDALAKIFKTISQKEAEHRSAVEQSESDYSSAVTLVIDRWREWWQESPTPSRLEIIPKLDPKFRLCFPLAAHALNHVEAAWDSRVSFPWVAKSGTRIAFEHGLTAQWVLLTEDGEGLLKAQLDRNSFVRRERYLASIRKLGESDASYAQIHGLNDADLTMLVGQRPVSSRRSIEDLCRRFASADMANLFYDICRDLSEAVHPSYGLIQSYLTFDRDWAPIGVDWRGASGATGELIRALALSALWALYALEVCRVGQPNVGTVIEIGQRFGLPVDLRISDQQPEHQPADNRYWE